MALTSMASGKVIQKIQVSIQTNINIGNEKNNADGNIRILSLLLLSLSLSLSLSLLLARLVHIYVVEQVNSSFIYF